MSQNFMTSELCVQTMLEVIDEIEHNREEQDELDNIHKGFTETVMREMKKSIPNFPIGVKVRKNANLGSNF